MRLVYSYYICNETDLYISSHTFSLTPTVYSQNAPLKLGAERMDVVTRLLKGKRVGLVVNQTSILEKRQIHLLDALVAEGIDVKKVFAPEHGFREPVMPERR